MSVRRLLNRPLFSVMMHGVALCLGVAGCSTEFADDDYKTEQPIRINEDAATIRRLGFSPNPVTVVTRTRVVWTNRDQVPHKIASFSGLFEGPVIRPGETFSFVFLAAGNYQYRCLVSGHTETGVINVTP